jgi:hypothetical protein
MKSKSEGSCEMCGHHVSLRQKAHIVAEGKKHGSNLLMLCPTCHVMFDTHVKPKIYKALAEAKVTNLPDSWKESIYAQAAASSRALKRKTQ